jgi:hypothetical protein
MALMELEGLHLYSFLAFPEIPGGSILAFFLGYYVGRILFILFYFIYYFFAVLGIEFRGSCLLA